MNKRTFLKVTVLGGTGLMISPRISFSALKNEQKSFILPELPFSYNALEPYIDAQTMELHHSKHHAGYTSKFNQAITNNNLKGKSIEEIFKNISSLPDTVRNNGGGYYNHKLFWEILSPQKSDPSPDFSDAIFNSFGSVENMKSKFSETAAGVFGSGWAWIIKDENGKLIITSTPNQDNPLMDISMVNGKPILTLDIWEHAYYLKYQNRRKDYIEAFWNIVNWKRVSELFKG